MDPFLSWIEALDKRHLGDLQFPEVRRAVQALSSIYVERRHRLDPAQNSGPLDGRGKRAAFATYFAPLHFLLVREIVRALGASDPEPAAVWDLGCGTGSAGAAWASELAGRPPVTGVDRNAWAAGEARWTYGAFGLRAQARTGDASSVKLPHGAGVVAAFTVNELAVESRDRLKRSLLGLMRQGSPILIVEPIARRGNLWWDEWAQAWLGAGGREDEWRFPTVLPERLSLMDRAAGLNHRELTGRSLWVSMPHRGIVP